MRSCGCELTLKICLRQRSERLAVIVAEQLALERTISHRVMPPAPANDDAPADEVRPQATPKSEAQHRRAAQALAALRAGDRA